jgi:type I restriction enzyme S subunit
MSVAGPIAKLGDIAVAIDYGHTASATREPVGPKFLRITDIQDDRVEWDLVPYCRCGEKERDSSKLATGDIVFARTGATTGKSYLIRDCPNNSVFASYLIRVRLESGTLPSYVAHFFKTPEYWRQISRSSTGTAQVGVNASSLKLLEVPLPPSPSSTKSPQFWIKPRR